MGKENIAALVSLLTELNSTTYPEAEETSWAPGGETDKGRQMTSGDLGGRVSQEPGETGLLGPIPEASWE